MATITWKLQTNRGMHTVCLKHGFFNGKREILLDGILIKQGKKLFDMGSHDIISVDGEDWEVLVVSNGMTYDYFLLHYGAPVLSDHQLEKGLTISDLMRKHGFLRESGLWKDLAQRLDLPDRPDPQAVFASRHRLLGMRGGYLVMIQKGIDRRSNGAVWSIYVRFNEMPSMEYLDRIRSDERVKAVLGKAYKLKSTLDGNANSIWIALPVVNKETVDDLSHCIRTFLSVVAENTRPIKISCDYQGCRHRASEPIKMVMYNGIPGFLCSECLAGLPGSREKAREEYKKAPSYLLPGLIAGAGVAVLGAAVWAAAAIVLDRIVAAISMLILLGVVRAIGKAGAKSSRTSLLLSAALTVISVTLGNAFSILLMMIRSGDPVAVQTLFLALEALFQDPTLLYLSYFITALGAGLYLFSFIIQQKEAERQAFTPRIEVLPENVNA